MRRHDLTNKKTVTKTKSTTKTKKMKKTFRKHPQRATQRDVIFETLVTFLTVKNNNPNILGDP